MSAMEIGYMVAAPAAILGIAFLLAAPFRTYRGVHERRRK